MKKTALLLTLLIMFISCSDEPTNTNNNELETIHGFVRTLINGQMAGILGDTTLNELYVDPRFNARVFPNPGNQKGDVSLGFNTYQNGYFEISITPAIGSDELKADLDDEPGIDISEYPKHTEMSTNKVFEGELRKGSNSIQLNGENFSIGFNIITLSRKESEEDNFIDYTKIPVFVVK